MRTLTHDNFMNFSYGVERFSDPMQDMLKNNINNALLQIQKAHEAPVKEKIKTHASHVSYDEAMRELKELGADIHAPKIPIEDAVKALKSIGML